MTLVYDLIFIIFILLYLPYVLCKGKGHRGFGIRFGLFSKELVETLKEKKNIWIHAVSVGEVIAVRGILEELQRLYPGHRIVLSTVTKTGYSLARSRFPECLVLYAPLDCSLIVKKFIRVIDPAFYMTAETEIWPNILTALHALGVPVFLVNGRISDRSFKGYQWVRFLARKVLGCVDVFCMQSETDAQRIQELGAPVERVQVVGNMKFDDVLEQGSLSARDLGFRDDHLLWVAGSTHPGEEEIVLNVFHSLRQEFPQLRLILAPRHVERTEEILRLVKKSGLEPVRFTQLSEGPGVEEAVVVVDTIGHLRALYGLATIVFVGKSLTATGGQNILEPAFFGKPIIIGPHMENFRDTAGCFYKENAVMRVEDERSLLAAVGSLLRDPPQRDQLGSAAKRVIDKYKGATAKTVHQVQIELQKAGEA